MFLLSDGYNSEESLKATLKSAADQADVIISTGGVSMGERDLLKYCLMVGLHAKVHFGRVFLKPGLAMYKFYCNWFVQKTIKLGSFFKKQSNLAARG